MTADEFRACMDALGWTWRDVSGWLACDPRMVRRWMSGKWAVPGVVADWIRLVVEARDVAAARVPEPGPWMRGQVRERAE